MVPSSLEAGAGAGGVDEDVSHGLGSEVKEVFFIVPQRAVAT